MDRKCYNSILEVKMRDKYKKEVELMEINCWYIIELVNFICWLEEV